MKKILILSAVAALSSALSARADFGLGDLAVLQAGNGTQTLANTGNSIFIDDFSAAGSLLNSFAVPTSGSSSLIISGSATSEGALTLSPDGTTLAFTGYNTALPFSSSLASSSSATVPRGYATMNQSGSYTLQGTTTTQFNANNIRTAVTDGQNNFWLGGASAAGNGTYYAGNTASAGTIQSTVANIRVQSIQNGNLTLSTATGTGNHGIWAMTGTPTGTATLTHIINTGNTSSPYAFAISPSGNTAYIADDGNFTTSSGIGGVERWDLIGGVWTQSYTLQPEAAGTAGARGLMVEFGSGSNPNVIYGTTAESSANELFTVTDNGATSTSTDLANAPANEAFRGLTLAPQDVPEPTTMALLGFGAMAALALRFRRH